MRNWTREDLPLLQGGEDSAAAPFAADRANRIENGILQGTGVVTQMPDWVVAATCTDGVNPNVAVVGGGQFNTQGLAASPSAGVCLSWDNTSDELYLHQLDDQGAILQSIPAYSTYAESVPPQITGFEMFGRYYVCPYGKESVVTRKGMGYFDPSGPTFTVPTFDVGGGAAILRFRGIAKHRGATILGWGYYDNSTPDRSHVLRYCRYGAPGTWVLDTTEQTAGYINVGTLNVPLVACAQSGPYTVLGKTSEVFVLDGDYSAQFSYRQIGSAHGPISTAGMTSTGPLCIWMAEKGPAYSLNGGQVTLLASERVLRRMQTYFDLSTVCAVHDSANTRVGFLCRQQRDLAGTPVSTNYPNKVLWWDYQRDALTEDGTPTTCVSLFTINAIAPSLPGPVGTPANLVAVPSSSGVELSWDHSIGDPTAQVSVEYTASGGATFTVAGPSGVGALGWTLSGLGAGSAYDWRLRYVKNGQYGSYTALNTFTTTTVASVPTDVHAFITSSYMYGSKTYSIATISWSQTEFSGGATAEVRENGAIVGSGFPASTTSTTITKLQDTLTPYSYTVLQRLVSGVASAEVPAAENPITYGPT